MTPAERFLLPAEIALAFGLVVRLIAPLPDVCYPVVILLVFILAVWGIATLGRGEIQVGHAGRYASEVDNFLTSADGKQGIKLYTVTDDEWHGVCKWMVDNDYGISETKMRKAGIKRFKYEKFRKELLDRRVVAWVDPRAAYNEDYRKQGVTCTLAGRAFIRYHAKAG